MIRRWLSRNLDLLVLVSVYRWRFLRWAHRNGWIYSRHVATFDAVNECFIEFLRKPTGPRPGTRPVPFNQKATPK